MLGAKPRSPDRQKGRERVKEKREREREGGEGKALRGKEVTCRNPRGQSTNRTPVSACSGPPDR
jgi:hypothetical protein